MQAKSSSAFSDSKPHYELLDGLRGVAALVVIWYHIFEGFCTSPFDQNFNHGYLAVDFFFILSGFVVGYAYDDRWKTTLTTGNFIKRRLVRLHPMVVLGAVLGALTFCLQGSEKWDGSPVAVSMLMVALLLHLFLLPALPGSGPEVRGNGEMFPLNGPSWSLFFEYIGNLLYAFVLRRLSTPAMRVLVVVAGALLAAFAVTDMSGFGHLGVGWSLSGNNLPGGFLRLLFAFSVGLLMSRNFKPRPVRGAFWICSVAVIALLSVPYVGTKLTNGIYDAVCVIIIFPLLVHIGASGKATDSYTSRICKFMGDISYPVYLIHYPVLYLFYSWVWTNGLAFSQVWPVTVILFIGFVVCAWLCLKFYDEPIRKWLSRRFVEGKTSKKEL